MQTFIDISKEDQEIVQELYKEGIFTEKDLDIFFTEIRKIIKGQSNYLINHQCIIQISQIPYGLKEIHQE